MKIRFLQVTAFLASVLFLSSPAIAETRVNMTKGVSSGCYTASEAEAEQGIRIHSELMVIGLNCTHMGKREGMNLYNDYRQFTADHGKLFADYETILMGYYKRQGKDPEATINKMRTDAANSISNDVADMRPDVFCSRYAPRIQKAKAMSDADIRKWAATPTPSHPVSRPMCGGK
jgi:hypothetical protein